MNYKVLYRKYRPDNFDNVIGQKYVMEILKNSIKKNKIAHAYLFSGPRGTGKTSTARILAKAINCLNNKDGSACNECTNCLSFNGNPDIIEIDAASNNGVDEIRELINNIKIMPTSLKYKVYIIDEVHMLSQSAFNALLLTLEEPPEHVVFILATTNIESIPITILSRCQRFDFKKIANNDILNQLKQICDSEKIDYEESGLEEIAVLSDGGMRDALSILDQLSKGEKKITSELVVSEVGSVSDKKIEELIESIEKKDLKKFEQIITDFSENNLNYKVVIKKIVYFLSKVATQIINNSKQWQIDYGTCKNIIIELNDIINKINISIEPYILIKITLLGYFNNINAKISLNEENKNIEKQESMEQKEDELKIKQKIPKITNISEKFIETRINNCFVEASKDYLLEIKKDWHDFVKSIDLALVKGLISDTDVVTASNKYAILVTTIKHKDMEINNDLNEIEKLFTEFSKKTYKLVFINEDKWNIEKRKYVENIQKKHKYTYITESEMIEETKIDNSNITNTISNIFDRNKIEVE